jgi:vacuolar protein sorting-associated protein 16
MYVILVSSSRSEWYQAAKFGRAFLDLFDPREFVTMGQTLKVLNALRYYEIGIPMTYQQWVIYSIRELSAEVASD